MAEVRTGDLIAGNVIAFRLMGPGEDPTLIVFESRNPVAGGAPNQVVLHESEIKAIVRAYQALPPLGGTHLSAG